MGRFRVLEPNNPTAVHDRTSGRVFHLPNWWEAQELADFLNAQQELIDQFKSCVYSGEKSGE